MSGNSNIENPHVTETTWDVTFGDAATIDDSFQNTTAVCAGVIVRRNWPLDVVRKFNSQSGGCNEVLGSDCVEAIIESTLWNNDTQSCGRALDLSSIRACRDTLRKGDASIATSMTNLLGQNVTSGQGIVQLTSEVHPGSEAEKEYETALNDLHIALIDVVTVGPDSFHSALQAKCNRVRRGGEDDKEDDKSGEDEGNDEGGDDGSGAHANGVSVGLFAAGVAAAMAAML